MLPFKEINLEENTFIREFKQDTDSGEFVWHRDRENRVVESIGETDWMIQIDNEFKKLYCKNNLITSFEGLEGTNVEILDCSNNKISSLNGMPLVSGHGSIIVHSNQLTSLNGLKLPNVIDIDSFRINASFNKITTLQGSNLSSIESMYSFQLQGNPLKSIEGCPPMIGSLNLSFTDLESLKGGPKIVGYLYLMGVPNFKTLDGFPQRADVLYVDRNFAFNDDDIKDYCRVKDIRRTI